MKIDLDFVVKQVDPNLVRLAKYLRPHLTKIGVAVFFMVLAGASSSLVALLLGKLTDLGFYNHDPLIIIAAPVGLIFISVLHGGSMFMSNYLLAKVSQAVLFVLRGQLYHNILRWPAEAYQRNPTGQVASKFVLEANVALSNAAKSAITLVRDSLQLFFLTLVLIYQNWQLSIVSFIVFPLIVSLLRYVSTRMKRVMERSQQSIATLLVLLKEVYRASRLIKINNNYNREVDRFVSANKTIRNILVNMAKYSSLGDPLSQVVGMMAVAVVIAVALYQAQSGALTMGEFVTFLTALLLILPPLRKLAGVNAEFVLVKVAAGSIFSTLDEKMEKDEGLYELEDVKGDVIFEDVSLKYPNSESFAVEHFSLNVTSGEHIALVGLSGAGKTSVVHMLPRFWNPTSGKIKIDGVDVNDCTLKSLRQQIAIVSQDVTIFEGTIRDNIAYGLNVSDDEMKKVVEAASLTSFVESLPKKLNTLVGEAGGRLSGGQRQRISIARALLRKAPILILDEATSALDSENEHQIKLALQKLMQGRTTFIVAHRFSSISGVDKIIAMEKGRIKEVGTCEELLRKGGLFKHLYDLQNLEMRESK